MNTATTAKKMSLVQLTLLVAVNMMGSGIIMLPANMAQVGAISLLSWGVTALGSMAIAYGFAQAGVFNSKAGGMAAYAEDAYGRDGYFLTFFLYFLSLAIGNVAIAISAVGYLAAFIPWLSSAPIATCIGVIVLVWLTTAANFGGPSITGKIGAITVWGVIIPVAGICVIGWFFFSGATFQQAWNPQGLSIGAGMSSSVALTLWAFLGMESAAQNSDAVENPEAQRAAGVHVRNARCGGDLHPVDHRHPGHRAQQAARRIHRPLRRCLRANVRRDRGHDHPRTRDPRVPGIVAGLAVHHRPDRQDGGGRRPVPQALREDQSHARAGGGHGRDGRGADPLALSTISPTLSEQFSALVNLAVVTNVIPYIIALSALGVIMRKAGVPQKTYRINIFVSVVGMLYSTYAIFASGGGAVMGGTIVMALTFIIYGFLATKFLPPAESGPARTNT